MPSITIYPSSPISIFNCSVIEKLLQNVCDLKPNEFNIIEHRRTNGEITIMLESETINSGELTLMYLKLETELRTKTFEEITQLLQD